MNEVDAKNLTESLMRKHGVDMTVWKFVWSNGQRRLGYAGTKISRRSFGIKHRMSVSRKLVAHAAESDIRNTILHEIAHILAGIENKHNNVWKAVCVRIGARPERCASIEVDTGKPLFWIVCDNCDNRIGKGFRKPRKSLDGYVHTKCPNGTRRSKGKLRRVAA